MATPGVQKIIKTVNVVKKAITVIKNGQPFTTVVAETIVIVYNIWN